MLQADQHKMNDSLGQVVGLKSIELVKEVECKIELDIKGVGGGRLSLVW